MHERAAVQGRQLEEPFGRVLDPHLQHVGRAGTGTGTSPTPAGGSARPTSPVAGERTRSRTAATLPSQRVSAADVRAATASMPGRDRRAGHERVRRRVTAVRRERREHTEVVLDDAGRGVDAVAARPRTTGPRRARRPAVSLAKSLPKTRSPVSAVAVSSR